MEFPTQYPKYLEYMVHQYFIGKRVVYTDQKNKERIEWFLVESEELRKGITKIWSFLEAVNNELQEASNE